MLEELPQSLKLLRTTEAAGFDGRRLDQMTRTPKILARQLGLAKRVPLICLPHHDNHAWFSYAASPFADDGEPVAVAVLDGTGDQGSISLYVVENGAMRRLSIKHDGHARTVDVRIPAGVGDGSRVRVAGEGEPGTGGAQAGDLYLRIRTAPHPSFERKGRDPEQFTCGFWPYALCSAISIT